MIRRESALRKKVTVNQRLPVNNLIARAALVMAVLSVCTMLGALMLRAALNEQGNTSSAEVLGSPSTTSVTKTQDVTDPLASLQRQTKVFLPVVIRPQQVVTDANPPPLTIPQPTLSWMFGARILQPQPTPIPQPVSAPQTPPQTAEGAFTTEEPTPSQSFRYAFPIKPPEVAGYAREHHTYPATDIFTPHRAVFVAVTDGVIDELGREDVWDPVINDPANRSGLYVSIIGDDGVRYYGSHLDEVVEGLEAGDRVAAGQTIGYVGRTGNARTTPYHVHFGISYPTFPGDWEIRRGVIWPWPYLDAWKRGENLTPDLSGVRP